LLTNPIYTSDSLQLASYGEKKLGLFGVKLTYNALPVDVASGSLSRSRIVEVGRGDYGRVMSLQGVKGSST
jgi:hypothetical protein